ncbi:MAG: hypothetical protein HKN31_09965 [Pricia sp.]|nr:hypothetical protein [Pricia sp.]
METVIEKIRALPKADVHNHLHLGGSLALLKQKYPDTSLRIPKYYKGLDGMIDFINNEVNAEMVTADDMMYFMEMALKNCISDRVTYLEASIDISFVRFFNDSIEELISVVQQLKENFKPFVDFRPDIGINKDYDLQKAYSDGYICMNSGLFNGIDIYGLEINKKLDGFVEIFDYARKKSLKTKVHIGEFSDYRSIETAIYLLNPSEIQHGIKAADSTETMDLIAKKGIRLNICPQSNVCLGVVSSIADLPIRKLFDHGIRITINTDDHLLFNSTVSDQFVDLINHEMFSFKEIDTIRKNAFP